MTVTDQSIPWEKAPVGAIAAFRRNRKIYFLVRALWIVAFLAILAGVSLYAGSGLLWLVGISALVMFALASALFSASTHRELTFVWFLTPVALHAEDEVVALTRITRIEPGWLKVTVHKDRGFPCVMDMLAAPQDVAALLEKACQEARDRDRKPNTSDWTPP